MVSGATLSGSFQVLGPGQESMQPEGLRRADRDESVELGNGDPESPPVRRHAETIIAHLDLAPGAS